MPGEFVALAVAPGPFTVGIDLVRGDHHHGLDPGYQAAGFKQVRGTHQVGGPGLQRLPVGRTNQRLRRQVEDDFRTMLLDHPEQRLAVTDIAAQVGDRQAQRIPMAIFGSGWQRETDHLRAQLRQPGGQPGALEAGMAGEQDLAAPIAVSELGHFQIFQGAFPLSQRSFR
ncbi:hypothetical protein D9M68_831940 [compost metagenome]